LAHKYYGIEKYDVSNPENPVFIDSNDSHDYVKLLVSYENTLYSMDSYYGGFYTFNADTMEFNTTDRDISYINKMVVANDKLYINGELDGEYGVYEFNLTNSLEPNYNAKFVSYSSYSNALHFTLNDNNLFLESKTSIYIYNIKNGKKVASFDFPYNIYDMTANNSYLFIAKNKGYDYPIVVFDNTDPQNIKEIARIKSFKYVEKIKIKDNKLYIVTQKGLYVIDINKLNL
jgi:hypothetical protein